MAKATRIIGAMGEASLVETNKPGLDQRPEPFDLKGEGGEVIARRIGKTAGDSIELGEEDSGKKLAELIMQHPQGELLERKIGEIIEHFEKFEKAGKLRTGYGSPKGPTIGLASTSAGMVHLERKGIIDEARLKEGWATLPQFIFARLYMQDSPVIRAQWEDLALEILQLEADRHIEERQSSKK